MTGMPHATVTRTKLPQYVHPSLSPSSASDEAPFPISYRYPHYAGACLIVLSIRMRLRACSSIATTATATPPHYAFGPNIELIRKTMKPPILFPLGLFQWLVM